MRVAGELSDRPKVTADLPKLLTVPEVAEVLRTTNKAIYDLVRRNQLPGVIRLGRRILFDADEIARHIQANRTQE